MRSVALREGRRIAAVGADPILTHGGADDFLDYLKGQFMYSYEDRLRAVRFHIKLGKRIGLTIRQIGYPTKNALKSWHHEYEQRLDPPAVYVRQPRYLQAHKVQAVGH